ncbi:MAG: choice-of-anchor D domain-containing protein [Candidatus Latescibacteria bacterium]|nr:choice-of-anchor D domain-containing protein [Candidatus Latescibacterota bacterium]
MSRPLVFLAFTALLWGLSAEAQQALSSSAPGNGGVLSGGNFRLLGSAGQPVTGMASSASHTSRAGLWYRVAIPSAAPPAPSPAPSPAPTPTPTPPPAPGISLSVSSIALGNTSLGSTSQKTLVIANPGSASLSITDVSASGADAAQFTPSPATAAIAPGESQTITVTFAPSATGPKSASLAITHNAASSPATVSLSGSGIAPPVVDTVAHLTPQVAFSAAVTTGPAPLAIRFTSANTGGPVTTYTWSFGDGQIASTPRDTLSHTYQRAGVYTVSLTATGPGGTDTESKAAFITVSEAQPVIALSSPSLNFGPVRLGQSRAENFTLHNRGNAPLQVSAISRSGADLGQFAVRPAVFTIAAGDSLAVNVSFTPAAGGEQAAALAIVHNAPGSPARVLLSGIGLQPELAYRPERLSFGQVATGAAAQLPLVLYNVGNDTLTVGAITSSRREFAVTPPANLRIAPGDSQQVAILFRPSLSGSRAGNITIASDDPARESLAIPTSGNGVALGLSMDLNPAEGDQQLRRAGGLRPGQQVEVQLFIDQAPAISGFTVRVSFDPEEVAFVPGSFVAGSLVPGLLGLADLKEGYVEVGGVTLEGGTGAGSGLLGSFSFEVLPGFDGESGLRIPLLIWERVTEGAQTIQADLQAVLTSAGGLPSPDFDGDGLVGFPDFFMFADAFGSSDPRFDLDGDGNVGFSDFFLFADSFGKGVD